MVQNRRRGNEGTGIALGILFFMLLGAIWFLNQNIAILFVMGLLPSIILAFTGSGQWHSMRVQTVGALNLLGILPYAKQIYENPWIFDQLIMQVGTWVIIYGLAALGYMLLYVGPFVASLIIQNMNKQKINSLLKQRQNLIEEWSAEVVSEPTSQADKPKFIQPKRR